MIEFSDRKIDEGISFHHATNVKHRTSLLRLYQIHPIEDRTTEGAFVSSIISKGNGRFPTMKALMEHLEDCYGMSLSTTASKHGESQLTGINVDFVNWDKNSDKPDLLEKAFELLSAVIREPLKENGGFPEKLFQQEKRSHKQAIESIINDKGMYAYQRAISEMFSGEPYAVYELGDIDSLSGITPKSAMEEFERRRASDRVYIYYYGPREEQEVIERARGIFSGLRSGTGNLGPTALHPRPREAREVIEKRPVQQGQLVQGYWTDVRLSSPEWHKFQVFNALFGGTATSKLFVNIREKHSAAYSIYSSIDGAKGLLYVCAGIDLGAYEKVRDLVAREYDDLRKGVFTDDELDTSKVYLAERYRGYEDSVGMPVALDLDQRLFSAHTDWQDRGAKIMEVTREDVMEVAERTCLDTSYFLGGA
ncbi:MAG: insulinase family protein [Planctomycetes bacterium]|nr:insulinase family protein [Planctomycetota bacterium]